MLNNAYIRLTGRVLGIVVVLILFAFGVISCVKGNDTGSGYETNPSILKKISGKVADKLYSLKNPGPDLKDDVLNEDGIRPEVANKLESLPSTVRVFKKLRTPEQKEILRKFTIAASLSNQQLMDSVGDRLKAAKAVDDYSYIIACSSRMYGDEGFDMVDAIDRETKDTSERKYKALAASLPFRGQMTETKDLTKEECFARFGGSK